MPYLGQEDTPKDFKLRNEVKLHHDLDQLNMSLHMATRRGLNFLVNLVGKKTKSHTDWEKIGKSIEQSHLTDDAKIRLKYRHSLFQEYVKPKPKPLAYALLPLVIFWLAKSVWSAKMQERKIEQILQNKRKKRRLAQQKEKERKRREKQALTS